MPCSPRSSERRCSSCNVRSKMPAEPARPATRQAHPGCAHRRQLVPDPMAGPAVKANRHCRLQWRRVAPSSPCACRSAPIAKCGMFTTSSSRRRCASSSPLQQELLAATDVLQNNPNAAWAQTRFNHAKANFDRVFTSMVNVQDRGSPPTTDLPGRDAEPRRDSRRRGQHRARLFPIALPFQSATNTSGGAATDPKVLERSLAPGSTSLSTIGTCATSTARAVTDCNADLHKQANEALVLYCARRPTSTSCALSTTMTRPYCRACPLRPRAALRPA